MSKMSKMTGMTRNTEMTRKTGMTRVTGWNDQDNQDDWNDLDDWDDQDDWDKQMTGMSIILSFPLKIIVRFVSLNKRKFHSQKRRGTIVPKALWLCLSGCVSYLAATRAPSIIRNTVACTRGSAFDLKRKGDKMSGCISMQITLNT